MRRPATKSKPAAMHKMAKMTAAAELDPVRGNDPGTVTGSVVVVVATVPPCSRRVVVDSGSLVVVVVKIVVEPFTSVVEVVVSGTVDVVVLPCSLIVVVVSGTVVDVVVSGTVVDVDVEVDVDVDVEVEVDVDESGTVDEVVVVPWAPMQNTTWLIVGGWSPPLSGGCNALPLVCAGS